MNKVALINPPVKESLVWVREGRCQQLDIWGTPFPPLSLAYISASLESIGLESFIFDFTSNSVDPDVALKQVIQFNPSFVVLSTSTPTIESDLGWFAHLLKKELPTITICVIGIHVSVLAEETLRIYPDIDFVIRGEPEITIRELIDGLIRNVNLETVNGVGFIKDGEVVLTTWRGFVDNLDNLLFPKWDGVNFKYYRMPIRNRPFNLISFERGCPFLCRFCSARAYYGSRVRRRTVAHIIEEINVNLRDGIRDFLFWTESMTLDKRYLDSFLDNLIKSGLNKEIQWVCNSRTDGLDEQMLFKMREASCWQIAVGLEFGNNDIIKLAQKGGSASVEKGEEVVRLGYKVGIAMDGHFIMGFPGETEKTMQDTINFACRIPLTFAHFYHAVPFPGSPLYNEAVSNGWFKMSGWDKVNQNTYTMFLDGLNPEIVDKYIKKAYHSFYFRTAVIKRIMRVPENGRELFNTFCLGMRFLNEVMA